MEYLEIDAWLSNRCDVDTSHRAGVALYERYGTSDVLKRLFARRDDDSARLLLIKQLKAHHDTLPLPSSEREPTRREAAPGHVSQTPAKRTRPDRPSDSPHAEPEVRELVERRRRLYRQAQALKPQAELLPTQQERADCAFRILDLRTEINKIWDQTNFYDEHGILPEPQTEQAGVWEKLPDIELLRLLDSHRKYVSKYRKSARSAVVEVEWQKRAHEIPQLEALIQNRKRDVVQY